MTFTAQELTGVIALCGALGVLTIFAIIDAYAVRACFSLAHAGIAASDLCAPEHLFRTTIEIGGMAVGLYGAARLVPAVFARKAS